MLKLKKLQIQGFKSFCDRTELQFPGSGVVGIVGPNGCGKSNLADAISWVLGEQSAKSLRGGRMEDVIFAGTRERPATGMAEVSLTLIDPQEYEIEAAPEAELEPERHAHEGWEDEPGAANGAGEGETDGAGAETATAAAVSGVVLTIRKRRKFVAHNRRGEIVVTRRLYRSGESEYLMNGRPCRLRDIQDIFMGTGLGPESYAIIEQGRIGQILSSKPYDRRAIIEEAAGVSKYKARRRLAEARLEASRLNLSRINDIFEEVTRQVGSLKRQASKAERYRMLKTDFEAQQRQLVQARAQAMQQAQEELRTRHAAATAELAAVQARIQQQETARAAAQQRISALEQELRQMTAEAGRLKLDADHARQQIAFQQQQGAELERREAGVREERRRLEAQAAALGGELEQAAKDQDAAGELAAAAQAVYAERRAAHQAAQAGLAEIERGLEATRRQTLEAMARAAQLGNQITQGETMLAGLEQQLARLEKDERGAQTELEAGGQRRGQLALEFQDQESEAQSLASSAGEMEARAAGLERDEAGEREAVQQARTQLAAAEARRRSLEEIVAHHGYSSEAVKRLFSDQKQVETIQPMGVLGEFLEVDAPYDRVLEQFLHDELNYVVVRGWQQADAGVGLLRAQEQGRATFLVHAEAGPATATAPAVSAEPGLVPLLGQVKALNGFRQGLGEILPKLRDAYLTESSEQAQRLSAEHPQSFFLTQQGECFHNFTLSGGAGSSSGPLSLKRELRELARRQAADEAAVTQHQQRLEVLGRQRQESTRELEQLRARRHEMEKKLLTSTQAVRQVENEMQRAQARLQQAQMESERARANRQQALERLQAARQEQGAVSGEIERLRVSEAESGASVEGARRRREAAAQAMSEAQAEGARVEERARAASAACERLRRQQQEIIERLAQLGQEAERLQGRQRELVETSARLTSELERLDAAVAASAAAQSQHEAALTTARERAEQAGGELAAGRAEMETRRQAHQECEVALARIEADLEHLRQTCRDDLNAELEEVLAEVAEADPERGLDLAGLEQAVRELRQKIDHLGPVNMMALEEYEEAKQRHDFMEGQRKDLLDSIADTQKAIQEMDTISRQKFEEAFERINAYFQESFRILFGGGQGFLRLSEIEGATESGVDIVAQPPGKKLQNALLLSGGEKAMTAMALLLAVFRYQPSPFCLLDEVDAPMDEANVGRFSDMVKQMGASTQFILITHNRRTMEAAPTLYGVTMPQPGVSRLVSVMIEEAQRAAAS